MLEVLLSATLRALVGNTVVWRVIMDRHDHRWYNILPGATIPGCGGCCGR